MPLQATSGAASYDAFGGGVPVEPVYIEQIFQTWLYTGNGTTQTITNGIDLAGKGGLVWTKNRAAGSVGATHLLGTNQQPNILRTSDTGFDWSPVSGIYSSFNSNGYTLASSNFSGENGVTYVSWTFRKAPKFFDVVTWVGTGSVQNVAHSLGSVPGCIIVKRINDTQNWRVYHRSLGSGLYINLDQTDAASSAGAAFMWNNTDPTSTVFTVNSNSSVNASGSTYVAYIFAHNAGGFGLTGTDNVISCGSFTQASGGTTVNLGFEPQWVMVKNSSGTGNWFIFDNMRGNTVTLYPNLSNAEGDQGAGSFQYNATGFTMADYITGSVGSTLIYIAIRRGPMKVPTTGTSVFAPEILTGNSSGETGQLVTTGFPVDLALMKIRAGATASTVAYDRLRGIANLGSSPSPTLRTATTDAEFNGGDIFSADNNTGIRNFGSGASITKVNWLFRRAPGFFDEVCYTGTGSATAVTHNLTVVPELIITKVRSAGSSDGNWYVTLPVNSTSFRFGNLNTTGDLSLISGASVSANITATSFNLPAIFGGSAGINESGFNYVAYLFASAPGVSKVGTFTGTGATQVINCGFTGGARFVLIKATSTTGNWLVWDTARGMIPSNDPYLALNSTAAEVTGTDWVDTATAGFELSNAGGNLANSNGVSYIFWAVA